MDHKVVNRKWTILAPILVLALALSACASGGEKAASKAKPVEVVRVFPLGVENLPQGQCGMLLWTLKANQPVLVFRAIAGGEGLMVLDGNKAALASTQQAGEVKFGLGAQQSWVLKRQSKADIEVVTIDVTYGENFPNGIYVQDGVIKIINKDGWERVIPVAGLSGCRR